MSTASNHANDGASESVAVDGLSRAELVDHLRALGVVPGDVLLVHTSYRAVRPVAGGPEELVAALTDAVGAGGTIVMPAWAGDDEHPFDSATSAAASDLGVVANLFWRMPAVRRSDHPFAFAARGPAAAEIIGDPLPIPPHIDASPVGRVRDLGGKVLLLGVGHDANTTIHLGELEGGARYRRGYHIMVAVDGQPMRINYEEPDHCCELFRQVGDWLTVRGQQRDGRVGGAQAILVRATDVVGVAAEQVRRNPTIFLHPRSAGCAECHAAWESLDKSPD